MSVRSFCWVRKKGGSYPVAIYQPPPPSPRFFPAFSPPPPPPPPRLQYPFCMWWRASLNYVRHVAEKQPFIVCCLGKGETTCAGHSTRSIFVSRLCPHNCRTPRVRLDTKRLGSGGRICVVCVAALGSGQAGGQSGSSRQVCQLHDLQW